jgi:hypothetical protein
LQELVPRAQAFALFVQPSFTGVRAMAYVSDELTHFWGRTLLDDQARYELLKRILETRQLRHPALREASAWRTSVFPGRRFSEEKVFETTVVCFCDIPVEDLQIHMGKYSRFGVAFPKRFMISRAANPVYYVGMDFSMGSDDHVQVGKSGFDQNPRYWDEAVRHYLQVMSYLPDLMSIRPDMPSGIQLSQMQNMFDFRILGFIKPVDVAKLDDKHHKDNVYMEREWRIVGKLDFAFADISRIILPRAFADQFRKDFPALAGKTYEV